MKTIYRICFVFPLFTFLCGCGSNVMEIDEETGIVVAKSSVPFLRLELYDEEDHQSYEITKKDERKGSFSLDLNNIPDNYEVRFYYTIFNDSLIPNTDLHLLPDRYYSLCNRSALYGSALCRVDFYTDSIGAIHVIPRTKVLYTFQIDKENTIISATDSIPIKSITLTDYDTKDKFKIKKTDGKKFQTLDLNNVPKEFSITGYKDWEDESSHVIMANDEFHLLPLKRYSLRNSSNSWDVTHYQIEVETDSMGKIKDVTYLPYGRKWKSQDVEK